MAIPMLKALDILQSAGCLDFLEKGAARALAQLERLRPEACAMLTEEARASLRRSYRERMEILYYQALIEDVRERMNQFDPIHSMVISRKSIEPARKAAEAIAAEGGVDERLHERFPLLEEYETRVYENYIASFLEFFDALTAQREEISARLLDGKRFTQIQRLSAGGADLHRHGRSVMGVWTDAGVFYYKPHDCGLDALYHEIVSRWFSDCTVAADVAEGEGVAFVTCLRQEPLEREEELSLYFRNFGILTALFHGLGSCDMHQENVMACGTRPSAIDIETLIVPLRRGPAQGAALQPQAAGMLDSVLRVGVLPRRSYRMPLLSPLYTASESVVSLPEYGGKRCTVEGFESGFRQGFTEGYRRLLDVRGEIKELFAGRRGATVRCLLQNTAYYDQIRRILFRPENLRDKASREKVFHRLCVPYEQSGVKIDRAIVDYERACLLQTDIPYYCTTLDNEDLCGETAAQIVLPGYFREGALQTVLRRLDQLSDSELRYEEDVIRDSFAQAPLDVPREKEKEPVAEESVTPENAKEIAATILRTLQDTVAHDAAGNILWSSSAAQLRGVRSCGIPAAIADVGAYCAAILRCGDMAAQHSAAIALASLCAERLRSLVEQWELMLADQIAGALPAGCCGGLGGILFACDAMTRAGVPQARETCAAILRLIETRKPYMGRELTVSEGTAGLLLALADAPRDDEKSIIVVRACAERLLTGLAEGKPLAPRDDADIGAALAAAYAQLGEARYAQAALAALSRARDAYDPALQGWPDSAESLVWLADRGPHAAGIALAAHAAARRLQGFAGAEAATALRELAMESLLSETELQHFDVLSEGNALSALCLTRLGRIDRAGQVLEAMRRRAARRGCYTVTAPGIRSFFDPSLCLGATGVGYAAIAWLDAKKRENDAI